MTSTTRGQPLPLWKPLRRQARHIWKRYLRWPTPLWRLRGHARLRLAGEEFRFVIDDVNLWWIWRLWKGRWEAPVHHFLRETLRPGDVFFDVGAYMGEYSLLAARLVQPNGRVYAFEPDPVARRLLERNLARNGAANVVVIPSALMDRAGRAWLDGQSWRELGSSDSTVSSRPGAVEVETTTLGGFCQRHQISPSVVKIDTPGAEPEVVAGGTEVLRNARIVIVELNERKLRQVGHDPTAFLDSLFDIGRRITVLHQRSPDGPRPGAELMRGTAVTSYMNVALTRDRTRATDNGSVRPMRIAFHVPHAGYLEPGYSGDHTLPRTLLAGLRQRGHEVRVVSRTDPCDLTRRHAPLRGFLAEGLRIRREMRRFSPDAWFVYAPSDGCPDLFGWWLRLPRYLVYGANAPHEWPGTWRARLLAFANRRALARADRVTAIRHTSTDRLRAYGVGEERLSLLPPGAQEWDWIPSQAEARSRLGIPAEVPMVLCVARFSMSKSGRPKKTEMILDLISAVAPLPDVVLVLVGEGKGRARLEAAAAAIQPSGRVRFVGLVEHPELVWYYAACDVYAFPHPKDDSWVSIMEAQFCGRPVITMRTRSAEITVEEGRTGLLANDVQEFRAQVAALAADRARCRSMGQAAREYVRRHHSIDTRVRQIEALLQGAQRSDG